MGKAASIFFYLACAVALASVTVQMLSPSARAETKNAAESDAELERFVLSLYRAIDAGEYETVARMMVEGRWAKGNAPREYHFDGLLAPDELVRHLTSDYGENGWMIRFVTLQSLGSRRLPDGLGDDPALRREREIVRLLERRAGGPLPLAEATLKGHVSGRCNIINWERRVPLVLIDGKWIAVSRGTPEDYELVRREQLFKPIRF